jgi:hypothetical protein
MEKFTPVVKKAGHFLYSLFFTRDDDLDVLQVLFTAIIVIALMATWHSITSILTEEAVKIEALVTLRWLAGLLVITAVPKWLVPTFSSIVEKKLPSSEKNESTDNPEPRPTSSRWTRGAGE